MFDGVEIFVPRRRAMRVCDDPSGALNFATGSAVVSLMPHTLTRPARPIRVLVVDDDPSMLALYKHALIRWAAPVLVESAERALAIIEGGAVFDVVLCDLELDGMSGRDLLKALQLEHPSHAARMVIVSGTAACDADANFLRALGDRWVEKPVKPFVLQAVVQTIGRIRAA